MQNYSFFFYKQKVCRHWADFLFIHFLYKPQQLTSAQHAGAD